MTCPVCQRENPDGAVFCGGCGKVLSCVRCGTPAGSASRFCDRCGHELARPLAASQPYPPHQRAHTNGFAVASLILGILWLYWVGSVLALVFGYMAKRSIDRSNGTEEGRGLALAGIILGWIGVGILTLIVIGVVLSIATGNGPADDGDIGRYDALAALVSWR
jgi:hypothetical protein